MTWIKSNYFLLLYNLLNNKKMTVRDFITQTENTLMEEYRSVVAYGYAIDNNSIEVRCFSENVADLVIIKDKYFGSDNGAMICEDTDPQSGTFGMHYLLAMKKF